MSGARSGRRGSNPSVTMPINAFLARTGAGQRKRRGSFSSITAMHSASSHSFLTSPAAQHRQQRQQRRSSVSMVREISEFDLFVSKLYQAKCVVCVCVCVCVCIYVLVCLCLLVFLVI